MFLHVYFFVFDASLQLSNQLRRSDSSQAGMKHAVLNACKIRLQKHQSAEGATEKYLCRAFGTFNILMVMNAGVPCYALHRLSGNCRP